MKVKRQPSLPKPAFEPVTLEITLETKDELLTLWHHLNIDFSHVKTATDTTSKSLPDNPSGIDLLWRELDELYQERYL